MILWILGAFLAYFLIRDANLRQPLDTFDWVMVIFWPAFTVLAIGQEAYERVRYGG